MHEKTLTRAHRAHILSSEAESDKPDLNTLSAWEHIRLLSEPKATRKEAQEHIRSITEKLLQRYFKNVRNADTVLMPILRSGLAMWSTANAFFTDPQSSFVWGIKDRTSSRASVFFPKRNSMNNNVILLDPIIASGNTIIEVCRALYAKNLRSESPISIISCYASPEGMENILKEIPNARLFVACVAKSMTRDGYLIPSTNGDLGDKLFGKPEEASAT